MPAEEVPPVHSDRPRRGRQAEAARNDEAILEAARAVLLRDPTASMATVAHAAGVGVGGLYRRYAGRDELLQHVCGDGLRQFVALAEQATSDEGDAWQAFETFLRAVVDADVHALTVRLAGTFTSTDELRALAGRGGTLVEAIVRRAHESGDLRSDVGSADVPMLLEQLTAVRVDDHARTRELRRRYLALHLDGLRSGGTPLPDVPPPTSAELRERWDRSH
ncbi:TetR/AcrR family transcriptional regulator [Terrabacter sp. MAHUQ-38]|uniref:TetR/AcrR family transcriptional regulator n=1 Tax=unclassified Terrabacter TaxID=2630222 RepID=UPI00165D33AB|nr:TetR/AcrR family transcriptional regulator [Terrabacter sp. MAHUQ-38]MBC9821339.1 TetR/AcrR family transcriptional regulator [Terrabacter sp. MAHUQ-38]